MKKTLFLILTMIAFSANAAPDLTKNLVYNGNMEAEYNCSLPPALPKTCTDIPGWKLLKSSGASATLSFQPDTVVSNRLYLSVSSLPPFNFAQAGQDKVFTVTAGVYQYWFNAYVASTKTYARIYIYNAAKQVIKYIDIALPREKKHVKFTDMFVVPIGATYAELRFGLTSPGWVLIDNVIVNRRPYVINY